MARPKGISWRWRPEHITSWLMDDNLLICVFKGQLATCHAVDYADHTRLRYPLSVFWRDDKGTFHVYTIRENDTARAGRTGKSFQRANAERVERTRIYVS